MLKVHIILGSTRTGRRTDKVKTWFLKEAANRQDVEFEVQDLRDWHLLMFQQPSSPQAQRWGDKVADADAFVIITPEYNHGYPSVLKNALDYPYKQWNNKPVAFIGYSTGIGGAIRAVEQLRLVAVELQMAPIRNSVFFPTVDDKIDDEGNLLKDQDYYKQALVNLLDQLCWWGEALKKAREGK